MDLKNFSFSCPHCNHTLNRGEEIELHTLRNTGEKGTIYMSAAFGNYSYRHSPEVEFIDGELVEFFCPGCQENLEDPQHENFALLSMDVGNNIKFEVIFSRVAGKRKTYVITDDGIETYQG